MSSWRCCDWEPFTARRVELQLRTLFGFSTSGENLNCSVNGDAVKTRNLSSLYTLLSVYIVNYLFITTIKLPKFCTDKPWYILKDG